MTSVKVISPFLYFNSVYLLQSISCRSISFSSRRNLAKLIDGKGIAKNILLELRKEVELWRHKNNTPHLNVILVGDEQSSAIYVKNKINAAREVGIETEVLHFPSTISETELIKQIENLNHNPLVDGILLQLPLPEHICRTTVCNLISPDKDVDGFTSVNFGKFCLGLETIVPCTVLAVHELIVNTGICLRGKNAVVCGRSKHVGLPIALLLQASDSISGLKGFDATTTICHRYTSQKNLTHFTQSADIIISATGIAELIHGNMVKSGAIVIDVGLTRKVNKETGKSQIIGDVCFEEVKQVADYITPVPGGVGPLTVAMLIKNTMLTTMNRRG